MLIAPLAPEVRRDKALWAQEAPMSAMSKSLPPGGVTQRTYVAAPMELALRVQSPLVRPPAAGWGSTMFPAAPLLLLVLLNRGPCVHLRLQGFSQITRQIGTQRRVPSAMDEYGSYAVRWRRQELRVPWLRKELAGSGSNATSPGCTLPSAGV